MGKFRYMKMCMQRILRSGCTFVQPDQSIPCMHTQAMKHKKSIEGKMKTIQCAQVGGGSICCAHMA